MNQNSDTLKIRFKNNPVDSNRQYKHGAMAAL